MRNIRKLYIQGASGTRWGLNGDRGIYASGLSGFGFSAAPAFADLGRGFFVSVNGENTPQPSIPFSITFTRNPYETYQQFVDFLHGSDSFTLVYIPFGNKEFCRGVTIDSLQKGELTAVGWLECTFSLSCCSPWYLPTPTTLSLGSTGTDESKRYDYTYSPNLCYGADSSEALQGTIAGAGHIPGALELTYHGAITNPRIRLSGNISGKTYGICSVAVVLSANDSLKLCTRYEESYIKRVTSEGVETDLLDVLDLTLSPFFHIPTDEPCTISIESDSPFYGMAELLIFYYYRSV